jgi:predicted P-loop ATPase
MIQRVAGVFFALRCLEIEYLHSIEIDKVLAQAISLFHSGYKFWFTQDEIKRINKNNEEFQMRSIEEELLLNLF